MLDYLLPSPCLLCSKTGKPICDGCLKLLQLELHLKLVNDIPVYYLTNYNKEIGQVVLSIKDKGLTALIRPLLEEITWPENFKGAVLVPVPSTRKTEIRRGFSHTDLLAKQIARRCGRPRVAKLLSSSKPRLDQTGLSYQQRRTNLAGAFMVRSAISCDKPIILIDDVYTSGATMETARLALTGAGFKVLACWVIALVGEAESLI